MYQIVGYYICERIPIPGWLHRSGTMLSVSGCFDGIHPRLDTCFFQNDYIAPEEREGYKTRWGLNEERAGKLVTDVGALMGKGLAEDGRFTRLDDAHYFYESYFANGQCILVSLSTTEECFEMLQKEMVPAGPGTGSLLPGVPDENELLGFDILGWDICSFHSFLCNSLHEMLPGVRFNHYGLLKHTFEETAVFANRIQGYGEPVLWIPCRIGKCI